MQINSLKGHLCMTLANSFWGLMSPIAKIVMVGGIVSPLVVTDLRIAGAMILFWTISFFKPHEHVPHKDLLRLFFASIFGIILNQGSFLFGVRLTSPADASILTTSMPMWAMVFAAILLKDPITARKIIGIASAAGGAVLLILSSDGGTTASASGSGAYPIIGDLLVTTAQISFAFYIVRFGDLVKRYSLITVMKWMFTFAFICLVPFSARSLMETKWLDLSLNEILALVFIVVCATFLAYLLIAKGQTILRPTVCAIYNYVQPVVACVVAVVLGMDTFSIVKLIAVGFIFFGVWEVTQARSREEIEAHHKKEQEKALAQENKA